MRKTTTFSDGLTISFSGPGQAIPDFPPIVKNQFRRSVVRLGFSDIQAASDEEVREAMDRTAYVYPELAERERDNASNPATWRWAAAYVVAHPEFGATVGQIPRCQSRFALEGASL